MICEVFLRQTEGGTQHTEVTSGSKQSSLRSEWLTNLCSLASKLRNATLAIPSAIVFNSSAAAVVSVSTAFAAASNHHAHVHIGLSETAAENPPSSAEASTPAPPARQQHPLPLAAAGLTQTTIIPSSLPPTGSRRLSRRGREWWTIFFRSGRTSLDGSEFGGVADVDATTVGTIRCRVVVVSF